MKTLLTGAGGYIGLHILHELLSDGQQVTAVVRSPEKLSAFASESRLRIVEADLEDDAWLEVELPGHDVCIHTALLWGDIRAEMEGRDAAVTSRLFHAACQAGLKRGIFLSSAAVHRPFAGIMSEESELRTTDLYGANKAAGELFLRAACAQQQMTGVVLRPGPVVGLPAFASASYKTPGRLSRMICAAIEGHPMEVIRGDGRQFVDVSMVAKAVCRVTRVVEPHPTYLCVDREILTWEQIAHTVVACLNSSSRIQLLPKTSLEPTPRFCTQRIERLLGVQTNALPALREHICHFASSRKE